MPDKREDSFNVTDRRLFTADGELRKDVEEEESSPTRPTAVPAKEEAKRESAPPPPSAAEQNAQAEAYRKSSKELDAQVELGGHSSKELEITFERFLASLYMTAMLQLGLMHEQGGQPRVDIIGARQTVDTLSLISEKTKGNLTPAEANFLQNALYELRMAYVEVTNALANPPQATGTDAKR